jgi:hypothetical protein
LTTLCRVVGTTSRPPKWIKPQLTRLVDEALSNSLSQALDNPPVMPGVFERIRAAVCEALVGFCGYLDLGNVEELPGSAAPRTMHLRGAH